MNGSIINRSVLMLNQNYEPLTVCSARRAIVLSFQGKVEIIANKEGTPIRTVRKNYALPAVIRLWQYKHVPFKRIMLTRKNILIRDHKTCQYCGTSKGSMTVDHIIPKTVGGKDCWENLVCSCAKCNNKKGNMMPEKAGMQLLRKPVRPTFITFIQRHYSVDELWKPYLFIDSKQFSATT